MAAPRVLTDNLAAMPVAEPLPRYNPALHRRRSIRLPEHGYAGGIYFVTLCVHRRAHLFGEVVEGAMHPSGAGEIVQDEWDRTGSIRAEVVLDAFVVMPNHVHGIVGIIEGDSPTAVGATGQSPLRSGPNARPGPPPKSLGALIAGFKSAATKRINESRGTPGAKVWQRNYYERVLRNGRELELARRYVHDNPLRWHLDRYHPDRLD